MVRVPDLHYTASIPTGNNMIPPDEIHDRCVVASARGHRALRLQIPHTESSVVRSRNRELPLGVDSDARDRAQVAGQIDATHAAGVPKAQLGVLCARDDAPIRAM